MVKKRHLHTYLSLSSQLYDLDKPTVSTKEFEFYLHYLKEAQGPILEPMCGAGRFLIPFIQAGFDVDGFDASLFMLDALSEKCAQLNLSPKIWLQFLQDLNVHKSYNLIFIPDSSLNLILNLLDLKSAFNKIYTHLSKGAHFVFELATTYYAHHITVGASNTISVTRPDGKRIVQNVSVLPFDGQIASTTSQYQLLDKDQVLKTETENFSLFLHDPNQIELLLQEAGFLNIQFLKAFDRNQSASNDASIIVVDCQR